MTAKNEIPLDQVPGFFKRMREAGWIMRGNKKHWTAERICGLKPQSSKFGNIATWVGEVWFQSKREAESWKIISAMARAGEFTFPPLRQVPFHLPGKSKYVADFLFQTKKDLKVHVVDAKGHRTESYKLKRRMVQDLFKIVIEEM